MTEIGLSDLLTALTVFPWLFVLGLFVFTFLELSARDRGTEKALRMYRERGE